jgi:hypothetical protein
VNDLDERAKADVSILLAEYNNVQTEIANRSKAQGALLNITVTFSAAIAGFVLASPDRRLIAIVLAFLCSSLSAIWIDHARNITKIGKYVTLALWPQIREQIQRDTLTSHEDWVRKQDRNRIVWLSYVGPLMTIFVLPGVAGLAYSIPKISGIGLWVLWSTGAILTVLAAIYWVAYFFNHTIFAYIGDQYVSSSQDSGVTLAGESSTERIK